MPSLDFEAERARFLDYYAEHEVQLRAAIDAIGAVLTLLLQDREEYPTPTVTGRLKDRNESIRKLRRNPSRPAPRRM